MKKKALKKCLGILLAAALIAGTPGAVPVAAEELPEGALQEEVVETPVEEDALTDVAEDFSENSVEAVEEEGVLETEGTITVPADKYPVMEVNGQLEYHPDPIGYGNKEHLWALESNATATYDAITPDLANKTITFKNFVTGSELYILPASDGFTYIFEGTNSVKVIAIEQDNIFGGTPNPSGHVTFQCKEGGTLKTTAWYAGVENYLALANGTIADPSTYGDGNAITFSAAAADDKKTDDTSDTTDDKKTDDTSDTTDDSASSDEVMQNTEKMIQNVFKAALDRETDATGLEYWTKQINEEGRTIADLIRGVVFSEEFTNKGLNDKAFVEVLYKVCFDREGDEGGIKDWTQKMAAGLSRQEVVEGFLASKEYANYCSDNNMNSGSKTPSDTPSAATLSFVERLYTKCLGRASEAEGKDYWSKRISGKEESGSAAAHGFFFSAEYQNRKRTNEEYVNDLYQTILGREADAEGFSYWVEKLKNGTDREEIFRGFANSKEWDGICNKYGITK